MKSYPILPGCLLLALGLAYAASAQGTDALQGAMRLRGHVSLVCYADAVDLRTEAGSHRSVRLVGTLEELCNGGRYQVWLEHQAGIRGVALVDDEQTALDPSGRTLISQSLNANRRKRRLVLQFKGASPPSVVRVRMQPGF